MYLLGAIEPFVLNGEIFNTLIQYGVLGIMAFIFLKQSDNQQKMMTNNFQLMLDQVLGKDKSDSDALTSLLQSIQNHNLNSVKMLNEINAKIDTNQNNREMLIDMITDYNNLINELKSAIIKIKSNNSISAKHSKIGDILIEEGYITQEELEICLKKQANKDLSVLDKATEKISKM